LTFKKDADLPKKISDEDFTSLRKFEKYLSEAAHFPFTFGNTDALLRHVEACMDGLVSDDGFLGKLNGK